MDSRSEDSVKVLVAEKDEFLLRRIVLFLQNDKRYEVVGQAMNGWEVVTLSANAKPDVVLMDTCLPLLDGMRASHKIRQASPKTQVILFATKAFEDEAIGLVPV